MTFVEWINTSDTAWTPLKDHIQWRPDVYASVKDRAELVAMIDADPTLLGSDRDRYKAEGAKEWDRYARTVAQKTPEDSQAGAQKDDAQPGRWASFMGFLEAYGAGLFIVGIAIISLSVLAGILDQDSTLRDELSDTATARGLVTFVFTFGTVLVAFTLLVALFSSSEAAVVPKFEKGMAIFTGMIGILGTVFGFYFGETRESASAAAAGAEIQAGGQIRLLQGYLTLLGITYDPGTLTPAQWTAVADILAEDVPDDEKRARIEALLSGEAGEN